LVHAVDVGLSETGLDDSGLDEALLDNVAGRGRPAPGDGPAAAREVFEARRVRLNVLRMSTSVVAFGCLTWALVLYGQTSAT
jgi:hypothetical protein